MGLIIEFEDSYLHRNDTSASHLILTSPLSNTHIDRLTQAFEIYHSASLWYGFAVFDKIPEFLANTVMATRINAPLGAALFCRTKDPTLFLFHDLQENFRLITSDGYTLIIEDHIESVLAYLHNTNTS